MGFSVAMCFTCDGRSAMLRFVYLDEYHFFGVLRKCAGIVFAPVVLTTNESPNTNSPKYRNEPDD